MINRSEAVRLLVKYRTDEVVLASMSTIKEWNAVTNNFDLDFPLFGIMAQTPSIGLGVALARPERKVWVLNGDGSQLMNMTALATIAASKARNLVIFVFQNDLYESSGGQRLPDVEGLDFAVAARGLGIQRSYSFDDLEALSSQLPSILEQEGPLFIVLKVVKGDVIPAWWPGAVEQSRKLRRALGVEA